jgi:hypothetical protein
MYGVRVFIFRKRQPFSKELCVVYRYVFTILICAVQHPFGVCTADTMEYGATSVHSQHNYAFGNRITEQFHYFTYFYSVSFSVSFTSLFIAWLNKGTVARDDCLA